MKTTVFIVNSQLLHNLFQAFYKLGKAFIFARYTTVF